MKVKNELTSLDDKFRIANKVNAKYLESGSEKSKLLDELYEEVGTDAENVLTHTIDLKKEGKIFFFKVRLCHAINFAQCCKY